MDFKKYKIEEDHDADCKFYENGNWSCGNDHKTREKIYWLNERISKLEKAMKERSEICESALCRALAREALEK